MIRLVRICLAAAAIGAPVAAVAGGYTGPVSCDELAAMGRLQDGARCARGSQVYRVDTAHPGAVVNGVIVHQRGYVFYHVPATEVVRGKRCPYPHRPSDSVFSGGAGYIIKDTVRARIGCVY